MKKLCTAVVGLGLLFLCSGPSHAIPITETYSDTQNIYGFNGHIELNGNYYLPVGHASKWQPQTFNLSYELINKIVGKPSLALMLVENTKGTDKFLLDKIVFSWQLNEGSPNTILDPVAPPNGADKFLLDKIVSWQSNEGTPNTIPVVSPDGVSASPVPEPATILLLGTGLISFVGLRRRFRN